MEMNWQVLTSILKKNQFQIKNFLMLPIMKKNIVTSVIVLTAAIFTTSGIKTSVHKSFKLPAISKSNSIHIDHKLASAD